MPDELRESKGMVHQFNPEMEPDSAFTPGVLKHLVVGNKGRALDSRRTPVSVVGLVSETGYFVLRIEDFEDKGGIWEVPYEKVGNYQFELESAEASESSVTSYSQTILRLDRPLIVPRNLSQEKQTKKKLERLEEETGAWLQKHSKFFAAGTKLDTSLPAGPVELRQDFLAYMRSRELEDMESNFAAQFVSNPYSGEMVKGHRIVMAELGLVAFEDKIVRDAGLFDKPWDKERRERHILTRMAFVRGMLRKAGIPVLTLYRGLYCEGVPKPPENTTFVSSSFDFEVARSCFGSRETETTGVIWRQAVPVKRVFMTYLETEEMNQQFLEAEVVLLLEEGNTIF